jgi:4-diphosphocytidyl-2-C-methyl-D-erythritol kinase
MTGIGEIITDLQAPPLPAVLVNPLKQLATAAVFQEFDRMGGGEGHPSRAAPRWTNIAGAIHAITTAGNDLTGAARKLLPDIGEIERVLRADRRVLCASMSGSGATMFALVGSEGDARMLAADVAASHPHWWVHATMLGAA